ncbi:MAG: hypothetical protein J5I94_19180 [Phaeodactylibacter sp.]|nr:hypothetical protein [Phaeodactylibacter sp.]
MAKILAFNSILVLVLLMPAETSAFVKANYSVSHPAAVGTNSEAKPEKAGWPERLARSKFKKKARKAGRERQEARKLEGFSVASAAITAVGVLILFSEAAGVGALLILIGGLVGTVGLFRLAIHPGRFRKGSIVFALLGLILGGLILGIVLSLASQS